MFRVVKDPKAIKRLRQPAQGVKPTPACESLSVVQARGCGAIVLKMAGGTDGGQPQQSS
jgi:hypothetical protein